MPMTFVTKAVEADRNQMRGVLTVQKYSIGRARKQAMASGLLMAMRFGTISPKMMVK